MVHGSNGINGELLFNSNYFWIDNRHVHKKLWSVKLMETLMKNWAKTVKAEIANTVLTCGVTSTSSVEHRGWNRNAEDKPPRVSGFLMGRKYMPSLCEVKHKKAEIKSSVDNKTGLVMPRALLEVRKYDESLLYE